MLRFHSRCSVASRNWSDHASVRVVLCSSSLLGALHRRPDLRRQSVFHAAHRKESGPHVQHTLFTLKLA